MGKLNALERKVIGHDQAIAGLINAIRELMTPSEPKKKQPIGFAICALQGCSNTAKGRKPEAVERRTMNVTLMDLIIFTP